jgi:hypothetical protein
MDESGFLYHNIALSVEQHVTVLMLGNSGPKRIWLLIANGDNKAGRNLTIC